MSVDFGILIGRGRISPLGHFKNQISTIVTRQSTGTRLKPVEDTVQKSAGEISAPTPIFLGSGTATRILAFGKSSPCPPSPYRFTGESTLPTVPRRRDLIIFSISVFSFYSIPLLVFPHHHFFRTANRSFVPHANQPGKAIS